MKIARKFIKSILGFDEARTSTSRAESARSNKSLIEDCEWPAPKPFEVEYSQVQELNNTMLPLTLFKYCKDQAFRFNNASPEFVVSSILTCASALIGISCTITPKNRDKKWAVSQALWCFNIGEPSLLKTPTTKVGINLLNFAQDEVITPNNKVREKENLIKEKQIKTLFAQADAATDKDDEEQARMLIEEAEKIRASIEPTRVVMVNDCTPEALLVHIESNPNGVLVVRDELHGWLTNILDSKNTNERALYTEGFEGNNSYVQKRITRKEVIIPRMHIGVLGCIQPDRVRPVLKGRKNGESNDGFFERFQLGIFSNSKMMYTDSVTDDTLHRRMQHIFCCLASLKENNVEICANFTVEAQHLWDKWATDQAQKTSSSQINMQSVMGKYPSLVAKLSLVFQLMLEAELHDDFKNFAPSSTVSLESLKQAIAFSKLLLTHNCRIQEQSIEDNGLEIVKQVVEKMNRLPEQFSTRDLQRKGWAGVKTAEQCNKILKRLEEHGYVRKKLFVKQGHKPIERFVKNPHVKLIESRMQL
tara:strand:+ start:3350 stop:4948 length:1599 start_codon:yes stop_codon:yes gene_type:complete